MIQIIDLKKSFDGKLISNGINLEIPDGQMTVIVGRSGEGKSIFLKQIIGLIEPTSGKILVDGHEVTHLSSQQREQVFKEFGYVFQFAALLDSLTVFHNIGITLLEQGHPEKEVLPIVKKQLHMVNLPDDVLHKYPSELSGGMRKRVGLARTLVSQPKVILYDEPTTGLDPITSRIIHELMFDMQKKLSITSIVISHDTEIFNYADRVALLHAGKIRYSGSAKTVWESDNPYIFQFIRGLSEGPMKPDTAS
jgi:phospholipid/cholesterol/gamma-HCH transport system ATP-binding protein